MRGQPDANGGWEFAGRDPVLDPKLNLRDDTLPLSLSPRYFPSHPFIFLALPLLLCPCASTSPSLLISSPHILSSSPQCIPFSSFLDSLRLFFHLPPPPPSSS